MFIILGLIILVAAVVIGMVGVLTNHGGGHVLTHRFAVFGYHINGSTGRLFLYGIIVGAAAILGLSMILSGARRTSRRGHVARHGLKQSRGETAAVRKDRDDLIDQRDDLIDQRDAARAQPASALRNGSPVRNGDVDPDAGQRSLLHPLRHRAPSPGEAPSTPVVTDTPVGR